MKQANQFSQGEKEGTFEIKQESSLEPEKQIVLNIVESKGSKILLRQNRVKLTGNPAFDLYYRIDNYFIDHSPIKIKEKAAFFRLLAVMLNAGIPVIKSLHTLGLQSEKNRRLSRLLFDMAQSIENGRSLSEAMNDYPDIFDEAQIGMIKAGEASGQLNKTLLSLAEELEKTSKITGKVKGALVYPLVILCLLIAVIFLLMIMVIPQITKLFTQSSLELPLPTRIMVSLSSFLVAYWPVVILGFFLFIMAISAGKKTRPGRYLWDSMLLRLPVFGSIFQKSALSKFARSFSNLLGSGIPIIKSLEIVAHAIGNEVYKRRLLLTAEDMKRGIPMAENMSENKLFPTMLVNMIEVGEQTAQLEQVTVKVADFYDDEVDTVVQALTKIMEPLILVIIGVTVGGLVAAIMLPIIQLTNIAGGFT